MLLLPYEPQSDFFYHYNELVPLWLYCNRGKLQGEEEYFYEVLLKDAEKEDSFTNIYSYIEDRSSKVFKNFTINFSNCSEFIYASIDFAEEPSKLIQWELIMFHELGYNFDEYNPLIANIIYDITSDENIGDYAYESYHHDKNDSYDKQDSLSCWMLCFDFKQSISRLFYLDRTISDRVLDFKLSGYHHLIKPVSL